MPEDPFRSAEFEEYARDVLVDMVPKLKSSSFTLSLVPEDEGDVKFWVELGASIMLDKPIIVIVEPGRVLPVKLRAVADEVVEVELRGPDEMTPEGSEKLIAAMERVYDRTKRQ